MEIPQNPAIPIKFCSPQHIDGKIHQKIWSFDGGPLLNVRRVKSFTIGSPFILLILTRFLDDKPAKSLFYWLFFLARRAALQS